MRIAKNLITTMAILLLVNGFILSNNENPQEIGIYEHLDEYLPEGLTFTDENHNQVILKDIINKPTVLSFVYFDCPGLCNPLMDGLAEVIDRSDAVIGEEYQVFTIGINYEDNPEKALLKKEIFSKIISKKVPENSWRFLTGDSLSIALITDAVGYKFKREGKDFLHAAAIVIVSPDSKITRYLHGTYFLPFDLKMSVVEASQGKSAPTINKVLKYCFSYDAEGKKYVFNVTKISGSIILLIALGLFIGLLIKSNTKRKVVVQ